MLALIHALATYRLAVLVARDDGPADLVKLFRDWLDRHGLWYSPLRVASQLVKCTRCNSMWIGPAIAMHWAAIEGQPTSMALVAGVAFSGFTLFMEWLIP